MKSLTNAAGLAETLAGLPQLDIAALREQWRQLYCTEPPPFFRRNLLIYAVAYKLQERVYGGLKPSTRRLLKRVAEEVAAGKTITQSRKLKPGTRLLREWQGATHEVIVGEAGFIFRGERYRSLSEVARLITGSRWSGPRFFGLNAAPKDNNHGQH